MRKLQSQSLKVAKKVQQLIQFDEELQHRWGTDENSSESGNVGRLRQQSSATVTFDHEAFEEQLDLVTVSSIEGDFTITHTISSFFDNGSSIGGSVAAISPILPLRSGVYDETDSTQTRKEKGELLSESEDTRCNLCPIC